MNKQALLSYVANSYGGKQGDVNIHCMATPIMFTKTAYVGSFIYDYQDLQIRRQQMHWFEANFYNSSNNRCIMPPAQVSQIDYPLMLYKGYTPDNRELIMVNLADKEQPQKIINLYHMEFICFVGHNYVDREAKIGFLAADIET